MRAQEEGCVTPKVENGAMCPQAKKRVGLLGAAGSQERGRGPILPWSLQEEPALPAPSSHALGLQNGETMRFCWLPFVVLGHGSTRSPPHFPPSCRVVSAHSHCRAHPAAQPAFPPVLPGCKCLCQFSFLSKATVPKPTL